MLEGSRSKMDILEEAIPKKEGNHQEGPCPHSHQLRFLSQQDTEESHLGSLGTLKHLNKLQMKMYFDLVHNPKHGISQSLYRLWLKQKNMVQSKCDQCRLGIARLNFLYVLKDFARFFRRERPHGPATKYASTSAQLRPFSAPNCC